MSPNEFDRLKRYFEDLDLKYSCGGEIPIPEKLGDVYVIHPVAWDVSAERKAGAEAESYIGKDVGDTIFKPSDKIFTPKDEDLSPVIKATEDYMNLQNFGRGYEVPPSRVNYGIDPNFYKRVMPKEELESLIGRLPAIVTDTNYNMHHENAQIGVATLAYVPYATDFSRDYDLRVRNLSFGKETSGRRFDVRLNGISNLSPATDMENIANRIYLCREMGLGKKTLKTWSNMERISFNDRARDGEEIWIYPYVKVPVKSSRVLSKNSKVLYIDKNKPSLSRLKVDYLAHRIPFWSEGAIWYDGTENNLPEADRWYSSSYVNEKDRHSPHVNCETKVIGTKNLEDSYVTYPAELTVSYPEYGKYSKIGVVGGLPGLFAGEPWLFWPGLLLGVGAACFATLEASSIKNSEIASHIRENFANAFEYFYYDSKDGSNFVGGDNFPENKRTQGHYKGDLVYQNLKVNTNELLEKQKKLISDELQMGLSDLSAAAGVGYKSLSEFVSKELIGECDLKSELKKELIQMGKAFQEYFDFRECSSDERRRYWKEIGEVPIKGSPEKGYRSDCKEFNGSP